MFRLTQQLYFDKKTTILGLLFYLTWVNLTTFSQVIDTDKGKVEFIGLEQWTIKMIEDSLNVYSPKGNGLWGCAGDLKYSLHFADASVVRYAVDDSLYSVITVIEPHDSARVSWNPPIMGSSPILPEYAAIDSIVQQDYMTFQIAFLNYLEAKAGKVDSALGVIRDWGLDTTGAIRVWALLARANLKEDELLARRTLAGDPNPSNRGIAAAILVNFPENDLTWRALLSGLLDGDGFVNTTSRQSLNRLRNNYARVVDWSSSGRDIASLLSGTNLFAYADVLKVLARTHISSSLARTLIDPRTSELLLAYLKASRREEQELAHQFFVSLAGEDLGNDPDVWFRWTKDILRSSQHGRETPRLYDPPD